MNRHRVARILLVALLVGLGAATSQARGPEKRTYDLALPGKTWSLRLELAGFQVDREAMRPDSSGTMIQVSNEKTGLVLSVFLEAHPELTSVLECKNHYWPRAEASPLPKTRIRHVDRGDRALVYWMVERFEGLRIRQQHVNAYGYRDGICIDIHLSKTRYTAADDPLFEAALDSIRFAEVGAAAGAAAAAGTRFELFPLGPAGALRFEVPHGWSVDVRGPDSPSGAALGFKPPGDTPLLLLVTPFPAPDDGFDIPGWIEETAEMIRAKLLEVAVEESLPIRDLAGPGCRAKYASATDKTVEKGSETDFRYGTQGAAGIGRLVATFTILSNVPPGPETEAALGIVRSAMHLPPE